MVRALALVTDDPARKLNDDALLHDDLGLDSLDAVELLVLLEDRYGISVAWDELQDVATVADVMALVSSKLPSACPPAP